MKMFLKYILLLLIIGTLQTRDLSLTIFLYDDEKEIQATDIVLMGACLALSQNAYPIVINKDIVRAIFETKKKQHNPASILDVFRDKTNILHRLGRSKETVQPETTSLATSTLASSEELIKNVAQALLNHISDSFLNQNDWKIYKHLESNLYLFVPIKYTNEKIEELGEDDINQALGLNVENNPKVEEISLESLEEDAQQEKDFHALSIKDFFIQGSGNWNILLFGHGTCKSADGETNMIQSLKNFDIDDVGGAIAEFTIAEFKQFLLFLKNQIETSCFYYKTCHSGGVFSLIPYLTKKNTPLTLNYTVICNCFTNLPLLFTFTEYFLTKLNIDFNNTPQGQAPQESVNNILGILHNEILNLFNCQNLLKGLESYNASKNVKALTELIAAYNPELSEPNLYKKATLIPQILLPQATSFKIMRTSDKFTVIDPNEEITDLTEKSIAILQQTLARTLVINESHQKAPLIFSSKPMSAYHIIDRIQTNMDLDTFIKKCFFYLPLSSTHKYSEIPYTQIFLIKNFATSSNNYIPIINQPLTDDEPIEISHYNLPSELNNILIVASASKKYFGYHAIFQYEDQAIEATRLKNTTTTWSIASLNNSEEFKEISRFIRDFYLKEIMHTKRCVTETIKTLIHPTNPNLALYLNDLNKYFDMIEYLPKNLLAHLPTVSPLMASPGDISPFKPIEGFKPTKPH